MLTRDEIKALEDLYAYYQMWGTKRWRMLLPTGDNPPREAYESLVAQGYAQAQNVHDIFKKAQPRGLINTVLIKGLVWVVSKLNSPNQYQITDEGVVHWIELGRRTWIEKVSP